MKIKAAIFDMDGTLINSLFFWDSAWNRMGEKYLGIPDFRPSDDFIKESQHMLLAEGTAHLNKHYHICEDDKELLDFTNEKLKEFYINEAFLKEGAIELLEHLKACGVKLCLASATEMNYVRIALEAHGLDKYFPIVLSCADLKASKDKPDIYLKALELLGEDAADTCIFEDSYVALKTARGIGAHTVGVYDKHSYSEKLKENSDLFLSQEMSMKDLIPLFD